MSHIALPLDGDFGTRGPRPNYGCEDQETYFWSDVIVLCCVGHLLAGEETTAPRQRIDKPFCTSLDAEERPGKRAHMCWKQKETWAIHGAAAHDAQTTAGGAKAVVTEMPIKNNRTEPLAHVGDGIVHAPPERP